VQNTLIMDRDHVRCQVWGFRSAAADTAPLFLGRLLLIMNFTRTTPVADAQVGCCYCLPAKATGTPAIAKILAASQLFGGGARRVARLLITIFAKDAPAQQAPFCASGTSASLAFNTQRDTKIICKGGAQRIHFKKISRTGQGEL
jgi:hypothetical protein